MAGTGSAHSTDTQPEHLAQERVEAIGGWDRVLQRGLELAIALVLVLAVAFMGVRYEWGWLAWGELALVIATGLALALWLVRVWLNPSFGLVLNGSFVLLAAGAALVAIQLLPLPLSLLGLLSPGLKSHLPLWQTNTGEAVSWGPWRTLSLAPDRTVTGLRFFGLYCLLYFLVVQNVRTASQVRRVLTTIFAIGALTAILALLQYTFWAPKFYWSFDIPWVSHKYRWVRGPFTNKNHFAGFMAMSVGPGLLCLLSWMGALKRRSNRSRRSRDFWTPMAGFALLCMVGAAFLSLSRGGIVATATALSVAGLGLAYYGRSKRQWLVLTVLGCALLGILLGFAGTEKLQARLATLDVNELVEGRSGAKRTALWTALLHAVPDYPSLGTGIGTHEYVYRRYFAKAGPTVYTHAENGYLQLLVEGGVPALLLTALAIFWLARWCLKALRREHEDEASICAVAVAASLLAVVVHSAVDFVWYIPSHALLIAMLAGLACTLAGLRSHRMVTRSLRMPRWGTAALAACLSVAFVGWTGKSYCNARAASLYTAYALRHPMDDDDPQTAPREKVPHSQLDVDQLQAVAKYCPERAEYHYQLAEAYRARFLESPRYQEISMPLLQIRQTVRDSGFTSSTQVESWLASMLGAQGHGWLKEACRHYEQAVRQCPLFSPAYLRLSELRFVARSSVPSSAGLLAQAISTRQYDPDVLYNAGLDFFAQGSSVDAIDAWRRAALASAQHKRAILDQITGLVSLRALLDHFQPDLETCLWLAQTRFALPEQRQERLQLLLHAKGLAFERPLVKETARQLTELHTMLAEAGADKEAAACAQQALRANPHSFTLRIEMAKWLIDHAQWQEARQHLDWCSFRHPNHPKVRQLRLAVLKEKLSRRSHLR